MDKTRDNVKLRHRVEELEDLCESQRHQLDEFRKRIADLEIALAERIGYDTPYYADQPRAEAVGR